MNKKYVVLLLLCLGVQPTSYAMRADNRVYAAALARAAQHGAVQSAAVTGAHHHGADVDESQAVLSWNEQLRKYFSWLLPYPVLDHEYSGLEKWRVAGENYEGAWRQDGVGTRFVMNDHHHLINDQNGKPFVNCSRESKIRALQEEYAIETDRLEHRFAPVISDALFADLRVWFRRWIGANKLSFVLHYPYIANAVKYGGMAGAMYYLYTTYWVSPTQEDIDTDYFGDDEEEKE